MSFLNASQALNSSSGSVVEGKGVSGGAGGVGDDVGGGEGDGVEGGGAEGDCTEGDGAEGGGAEGDGAEGDGGEGASSVLSCSVFSGLGVTILVSLNSPESDILIPPDFLLFCLFLSLLKLVPEKSLLNGLDWAFSCELVISDSLS